MRLIVHAILSGIIVVFTINMVGLQVSPQIFLVAAVAFLMGVALPYLALK